MKKFTEFMLEKQQKLLKVSTDLEYNMSDL